MNEGPAGGEKKTQFAHFVTFIKKMLKNLNYANKLFILYPCCISIEAPSSSLTTEQTSCSNIYIYYSSVYIVAAQ